ncbi:hypothetical protein HanHA300_Chr01g0002491 [Helianthus annuus]|nr:hypothetical protein HanHA300_Chr01g0002491 [Helianthus annuus]
MVAFEELRGLAVVGRTVNLETLVDFDKLLRIAKIGFKNIQYLGGLTILVSFENSEGARSFLSSRKVWDPWFSKLESWEGHALPLERVVWLKISGVPLHLLNPEILDMVGGVFGKVLHVKKSFLEEKDLSVTRVAVLAGEANRVREMIKVVWKDRSFRVWVEEEPEDWIPDCLRFEEVSVDGSLSPNSVEPVANTAGSSPLASSPVVVCSKMGSRGGGEGVMKGQNREESRRLLKRRRVRVPMVWMIWGMFSIMTLFWVMRVGPRLLLLGKKVCLSFMHIRSLRDKGKVSCLIRGAHWAIWILVKNPGLIREIEPTSKRIVTHFL